MIRSVIGSREEFERANMPTASYDWLMHGYRFNQIKLEVFWLYPSCMLGMHPRDICLMLGHTWGYRLTLSINAID